MGKIESSANDPRNDKDIEHVSLFVDFKLNGNPVVSGLIDIHPSDESELAEEIRDLINHYKVRY